MIGVSIQKGFVDGAAEGVVEEGFEAVPDFGFQRGVFGRRREDLVPDAAVLRNEVGAIDDAFGELEEGFEENGGEREVVAAVIEAVFGAKVLGEGGDAGEAWFDQLGLTEGAGTDGNFVGHFAGGGLEVVFVFAHHAFREGEDDAIELEEVVDGVVVLEAIHAPDGRLGEGHFLGDGVVEDGFQGGEELYALSGGGLGFVLRGHFLELDDFEDGVDEIRIIKEIGLRFEFEEVDLAFYFAVFSVALDAVLLKNGLEGGGESVRVLVGGGGVEGTREEEKEGGEQERRASELLW
jgi:hypothetical protein